MNIIPHRANKTNIESSVGKRMLAVNRDLCSFGHWIDVALVNPARRLIPPGFLPVVVPTMMLVSHDVPLVFTPNVSKSLAMDFGAFRYLTTAAPTQTRRIRPFSTRNLGAVSIDKLVGLALDQALALARRRNEVRPLAASAMTISVWDAVISHVKLPSYATIIAYYYADL